MAGFQLLDQEDESAHFLLTSLTANSLTTTPTDNLHATRLLPIEERPFKRLSSRLLGPKTPYAEYLSRSVPSSDADSPPTTTTDEDLARLHASLRLFLTTLHYEFSLFNQNIQRTSLLLAANTSERTRYASEKLSIESKAVDVQSNISDLRTQLEQAQQTLATRKTWDVLADNITKGGKLRARDEQHVNIEKLRTEIEELEREGVELAQTWGERRTQLESVVREAKRLRRQIRGEKEPGEGPDAEEDDEVMGGDDRDRSNVGTPRPEDEVDEEGGATPLPEGQSGNATPNAHLTVGTPLPEIVEPVGEGKGDVDEMDTS